MVEILKLMLGRYSEEEYFGEQNSTLGYAVPLAMFFIFASFFYICLPVSGDQGEAERCRSHRDEEAIEDRQHCQNPAES